MTKLPQTPPSLAVGEAKPAAEEDGILIVETISKTTTEGPEAEDTEVHAVAAPAEDVEEREQIFQQHVCSARKTTLCPTVRDGWMKKRTKECCWDSAFLNASVPVV